MFTSTLGGAELTSGPAPLAWEDSPAPSGHDVCCRASQDSGE